MIKASRQYARLVSKRICQTDTLYGCEPSCEMVRVDFSFSADQGGARQRTIDVAALRARTAKRTPLCFC
jgi:hypothetical protein